MGFIPVPRQIMYALGKMTCQHKELIMFILIFGSAV